MIDANNYRITVQCRKTEDGILFEGTVHELPDVAVYGDSFDEAYEFAIDTIEGLRELAIEQGRSFPQPSIRETEFSGKFVSRVPKWLHRSLAVAAGVEGTSLNQYIVSVLSAHESRGQKESISPQRTEALMVITATTQPTASNAKLSSFEKSFAASYETHCVSGGGALVTVGNVITGPRDLATRRRPYAT